jgi:dihydroneopterin aldolase
VLTIALRRIEFDGRHGNTAVERRATRKFEVDVELDVDARAAETSDRLADTVDYSAVAEVIVGIGTGEPHHLLESLARQMVDTIGRRFTTARRVRLELRKLNPPTCPGHPAWSAVRLTSEPDRAP